MHDKEVRISSRALLDLLAEKMGYKSFLELHGFVKSASRPRSPINPFKGMHQEGRLIARVAVERSVTDDDDWLVFTFEDPDPAVSPYRLPPEQI